MTEILQTGWHKITNEQHHALEDVITSSQLKLFSQSPYKYYRKYIKKDWPVEPYKPSFKIGTAVHMLLLEPLEARSKVLVSPHDSKTAKFKKWLGEAVNGLDLENPNNGAGRYFDKDGTAYYVLDTEEQARVDSMVASAQEHKLYMSLAACCEPEITGISIDSQGRRYSCRGDLRGTLPTGTGLFIDIKTIESLSEYAITQHMFSMGYWLQQYHYLQVANMIEPGKYKYFYFFFIEKQFPHECALVHLEVTDAEAQRLRFEYIRLIGALHNAKALDQWPTFDEGQCSRIHVPYWFMSKL